MNGFALAGAVLVSAAVAFFWLHRWMARFISFGICAISLFTFAAIPAWRNALAGVFGNGPGMIALIILAAGGLFLFAVDFTKRHHPIRSSVFGAVGTTCGTLAWAMRDQLTTQGAKIGPQTQAALGQAVHQIRTGQAAAAETPSTRLMIIFMVLFFATAFVLFIRKRHSKRPYRNVKGFKELPAGPVRGALPAGSGSRRGLGMARRAFGVLTSGRNG